MISFRGIDHAALTVTDLDRSERFYTEVLDFVTILDVGYARICMHAQTGFVLSLNRHDDASGGDFTELTTGLDHLGLVAESRAELEEWQRRLEDAGVEHTPIRDMEFAAHLNFRDPDRIALELRAPNELWRALEERMRAGVTVEEIDAVVEQLMGPEFVPKRGRD